MSRADEIFIRNCRDILDNGIWDTDRPVRPKWDDGQSAHTIKKFGIINRYNLAEEFPILTLRRTYWKSAIDELLIRGSDRNSFMLQFLTGHGIMQYN